jgi:hypothetical protein
MAGINLEMIDFRIIFSFLSIELPLENVRLLRISVFLDHFSSFYSPEYKLFFPVFLKLFLEIML